MTDKDNKDDQKQLSSELVITAVGIGVIIVIFVINTAVIFYVADKMMSMEEKQSRQYLDQLQPTTSFELPDLMKEEIEAEEKKKKTPAGKSEKKKSSITPGDKPDGADQAVDQLK